MTKKIKIYGERNTMTNYVSHLIRLNLDVQELPGTIPDSIKRLQKKVFGSQWVRNLYFAYSYRKNLGWKHALVKPPAVLKSCAAVNSDLTILTITKNPYSWLLSMHRRPYNRGFSVPKRFEDFLIKPWWTFRRDNCAKMLEHPMELWNIKNRSYIAISGMPNTTNITSESILEDPIRFIGALSKKHSLGRKTSGFINHEVSTKGESRGFDFYRDYYINERWRPKLSSEAISIINHHIDKALMYHFGYKVIKAAG